MKNWICTWESVFGVVLSELFVKETTSSNFSAESLPVLCPFRWACFCLSFYPTGLAKHSTEAVNSVISKKKNNWDETCFLFKSDLWPFLSIHLTSRGLEKDLFGSELLILLFVAHARTCSGSPPPPPPPHSPSQTRNSMKSCCNNRRSLLRQGWERRRVFC